MSDIAIKVEGLSKQFRIGTGSNGYQTLRESMVNAATAPFRCLASVIGHRSSVSGPPPVVNSDNHIWALKDASFEVKHGEVVGIIGRNGAGESTLLKILSRITEPTTGWAEIHGRIGSLLEVGTGFHQELTGRENIFLGGALLGMKKAEILSKFDEIVGFAEIEKFIDTPVKYFSSGMYVRLAFAVAAHLETEVLLVDEVLAVGDVSFQKKCLGKMRETAKEGRTVLFVSHQMSSITGLCSRAIQMHRGQLVRDREPEMVIQQYLAEAANGLNPERHWEDPATRPGDSQLGLMAIRVLNEDGEIQRVFRSSQLIFVEMEFELFSHHPAFFVGFDLIDPNGGVIFRSCHNHGPEVEWPKIKQGRNRLQGIIPANLLNNGIYYVAPRIGLSFIRWIVFHEAETSFEIRMDHCPSPFWEASHSSAFPGVIAPSLVWKTGEAPQKKGSS